MLTTEQQEKIVNLMYPNGDSPKFHFSYSSEEFVFKIFKALVDECKKKELQIMIHWVSSDLMIGYEGYTNFEPDIFEGKFNNESICLAYLAVMESK